jgi:cytochrome c5
MKLAIILPVVALALGAASVRAATETLDAATKERVERFEKGPATIDVSKYPQALQDNYQVFAKKCTQCHKLSRPINSDYALPDEWSRYVKRMMYKPGSGISSSEGKQIFEFLAYDSSIRKKAMYDEKLAKLSADEKTAAEKKIADLHAKYDK